MGTTVTGRAPSDVPLVRAPAHSVVVVAGLPGAGKTSVLRRWAGAAGTVALDAEDVARRWAPLALPYRLLRPVVHLVHLVRVLVTLWSPASCVLTTDPLTSPLRRTLFRLAARASGRQLCIVLVDASPAQAREGQRRRGRTLGERRMQRHERRYGRAFSGPAGAVDVVLSRAQAARAGLIAADAGERLGSTRPAAGAAAATVGVGAGAPDG